MDKILNIQTQKSFKYLQEVEELAQEILANKDEKLELANVQNKIREGIRALQKSEERKAWLKVGSVYFRLPREECIANMKDEMDAVTLELNEKHEEIKSKVSKLRDLEHEPGIQGMGLKPLSNAEAKTIYSAFGIK